jgi:hypothetical protein
MGILPVDFYGQILELLEANGYVRGDLAAPDPNANLYVFPYDWRRGSDLAAAELSERLEALRRARGDAVLEVDLICQSNAARVARYFLKYGGASLSEAERGTAAPPAEIRVDRLILVGTANGGGLDVLPDLLEGRRFVPFLGRRFLPEVLFSFPAVYEELPAYAAPSQPRFVDGEGRPVEVDLQDAADWERLGWSVFAPRARERLERRARFDLFGDEAARRRHLADSLERGRRLAHLLRRDAPGFGTTRYYSIQNAYVPTPERAVLVERDGTWRVRWYDERTGSGHAPGDGFATLESQAWISHQEQAALAAPPFYVPARHRAILFHLEAKRRILEILAAP